MDRRKRREDRQLKSRIWITRELVAEVDRQHESAAGRTAAMITRLSILMAAASVAGGAALTQYRPGLFLVAAAVLAALAAMAGAVALLPRRVGENGIEEMQREMWNVDEPRALHVYLARKVETLRDEERLLDCNVLEGRFRSPYAFPDCNCCWCYRKSNVKESEWLTNRYHPLCRRGPSQE